MPDTTMDPNCIFCRIIAGELPGTVVAETAHSIAIMDINPATDGHLLVMPRRHTTDLTTVDPHDLTHLAGLTQQMAVLVKDRLGAEGVTVIQSTGAAAWQTVFHLHVHVIPRYAGDPLTLPWTPGPGDPERIAEAASRLRQPRRSGGGQA